MRSPILVDAVLNFEVRGEHVHVTDEGGAVHLALSRHTFLANVARAKAVAAAISEKATGNVLEMGRKRRH